VLTYGSLHRCIASDPLSRCSYCQCCSSVRIIMYMYSVRVVFICTWVTWLRTWCVWICQTSSKKLTTRRRYHCVWLETGDSLKTVSVRFSFFIKKSNTVATYSLNKPGVLPPQQPKLDVAHFGSFCACAVWLSISRIAICHRSADDWQNVTICLHCVCLTIQSSADVLACHVASDTIDQLRPVCLLPFSFCSAQQLCSNSKFTDCLINYYTDCHHCV